MAAPTAAPVAGIHHVTCVADDPQENVDHYAGVLGMRLVKRSVNQDDPHTYHLFYADHEGHPGTDLTFFPWPGAERGRQGAGQIERVALAVPSTSLAYWEERLDGHGVAWKTSKRFGEPALTFEDPHGLPLALVATPEADDRPFTAWTKSGVPAADQVRGLHAVEVRHRTVARSVAVAEGPLGMTTTATDGAWTRFSGSDAWCGHLDLTQDEEAPRGRPGVGTVHHVAWRVADPAHEDAVRARVGAAGLQATGVIDRFWFRSVYFREPGGVLYELATDGPGFGVDEPIESLGETLVLPPWLEANRASIERHLPRLVLPHHEA